jgi:hypothetical protein
MVRSVVSSTERIAALHLGPDTTGVAVGTSADPEATIILGIGSLKTAKTISDTRPRQRENWKSGSWFWRTKWPAQRILGGDAELFTADPSVREIALVAGQRTDSNVVQSIEQVERAFERLAAVSLGRPAAREGLPESNEFAATLLIVREFMHHLGYARMTVLA